MKSADFQSGPRLALHLSSLRAMVVLLAVGLPLPGRADMAAVTITFTGNCPTQVSEPAVTLSNQRMDYLTWTAVSMDADGNAVPYNEGYRVYFDPSQGGPPLKSGRRSELVYQKLHDDVPVADLKYTVVGDLCEHRPLEPRIRVQD